MSGLVESLLGGATVGERTRQPALSCAAAVGAPPGALCEGGSAQRTTYTQWRHVCTFFWVHWCFGLATAQSAARKTQTKMQLQETVSKV